MAGPWALPVAEQVSRILYMRSAGDEADLTARAKIRNTALRLFAERGHEAVTVREIAAGAGVSPALVLHHFGSKAGLRAAVDEHAARSFESVFAELDGASLESVLAGGNSGVAGRGLRRGSSPKARRCPPTCAGCCSPTIPSARPCSAGGTR